MASRKPNMLEAFQDSARAAQSAASQEPKASKAKQPRAPKSASREPAAGHRNSLFGDDVLGTRPRSAGIPAWMPVAVVVLLVAMAGTYWLTREMSRETRAGGGAVLELTEDIAEDLRALSSGEAEPVTAPDSNAPAAGSSMTADDRRFLDLSNRFTVCAIQYRDDARGRGLAGTAYVHLRANGLPAVSPVTKAGTVYVCVGAEPKLGGRLDEIRARLSELDGPPPKNEPGVFADAYDENIDNLYDR